MKIKKICFKIIRFDWHCLRYEGIIFVHFNFFLNNFGNESDEDMERHYQGFWNKAVINNYC